LDASAAGAAEIGEALQRSAATAAEAGIAYQKVASWVKYQPLNTVMC